MNDKTPIETAEIFKTEDSKTSLSRRQAMQGAAVAAVAGGALFANTREAKAVWPNAKDPTPRFETVLPHKGGMFSRAATLTADASPSIRGPCAV